MRDYPLARVMLVSRMGPVGRAIARATGSPYTHAALLIGDWVYEADAGGVTTRRIEGYRWPYDLFAVWGVDEYATALMATWCRATLRTNYRLTDVLAVGISLVLGGWRRERVLADRRLMRSAEYVCSALVYVGIDVETPEGAARPDLLEREPCLYAVERRVVL